MRRTMIHRAALLQLLTVLLTYKNGHKDQNAGCDRTATFAYMQCTGNWLIFHTSTSVEIGGIDWTERFYPTDYS